MKIKNTRLANRLDGLGYPMPEIKISNSFMAARKVGNLIYVSSATPLKYDGSEIIGKVGREVDLSLAKEAACLCLSHSLSLLQSMFDFPIEDEIEKVIELTFMMNGVPDFDKHSIGDSQDIGHVDKLKKD